jgi:hypothetical protein
MTVQMECRECRVYRASRGPTESRGQEVYRARQATRQELRRHRRVLPEKTEMMGPTEQLVSRESRDCRGEEEQQDQPAYRAVPHREPRRG